jgi:hypothetical protein
MLLFSLLMPSTVLVSRAIDINAPLDSIRYRVADLNQWLHWVKGMESPSVKIISSKEAKLGASQVVIQSVTDSTVLMDWVTNTNMQKSMIRLISHPNSRVSTIQWQFVQELRWYPWEKLGSFMNDKILGPMMEQNLLNLKQLVEQQKAD